MSELQKKCGIEVGKLSSTNCHLMLIIIRQQTASCFTMIHQPPKFGGGIAYILLPRSILGMAGIGTTHKGAAGMMPRKPNKKVVVLLPFQ
jgi:hypothetical protein